MHVHAFFRCTTSSCATNASVAGKICLACTCIRRGSAMQSHPHSACQHFFSGVAIKADAAAVVVRAMHADTAEAKSGIHMQLQKLCPFGTCKWAAHTLHTQSYLHSNQVRKMWHDKDVHIERYLCNWQGACHEVVIHLQRARWQTCMTPNMLTF